MCSYLQHLQRGAPFVSKRDILKLVVKPFLEFSRREDPADQLSSEGGLSHLETLTKSKGKNLLIVGFFLIQVANE